MTNETSESGGIYAEMQKVRGVISEESFVKKDGLTILIKEVNFYKKKLIYVRRLTLWQQDPTIKPLL
jgi:hypothetical protein